MTRVLIVDDDKLARKGLISIMPWSSYDMEVVGEAANGEKALLFLSENKVDLMFVDLAMPVVSGIELLRQTCRLYPKLRFVVLTFHEDFEYVQTAIRLGALDYISKVRLEMEDCNCIFDRIKLKLDADNEQPIKVNAINANAKGANALDANNEELWAKLEKGWHELYWLFDETVFQDLCKQLSETKPSVNRIVRQLIRAVSLVEEMTHINAGPWYDIENTQMAIGFVSLYRDSVYLEAARSSDLSDTSICILRSILLLHEQIAKPLHTDMVADYVNMSRSYFCQCFKKMVGMTFNDFLRKERTRMAEQYLCNTNQTISWIAQAVGYCDIKYFSHIFREQTDLLPSEFRSKFGRV